MRKFLRIAILRGRASIGSAFNVLKDTRGNAAIEFALVVPIFALVFVASVDLGMLVFSRFQLEAAVSASASYAIAHSDQVDGSNGSELAKNLALMFASNYRGDATAVIQVNNGPQARYDGTKIKIGGVSAQANACYCPKGNAASVDWGLPFTCNASCPDGGRAGRYVALTARQPYTPFFTMFDVVRDGFIAANAVVQTK